MLGGYHWDWWRVRASPWSNNTGARPSVQALRFVVETLRQHLGAWAEVGRAWHAEHPHDTAPVVCLYLQPSDLYNCEIRLMVGDRAAAFGRDWNDPDRPGRALPNWLAASAPDLIWRPLWVYEAWETEELADWTPLEMRRLQRYGPLVPSEVSPGYSVAKTDIAWVGIQPV